MKQQYFYLRVEVMRGGLEYEEWMDVCAFTLSGAITIARKRGATAILGAQGDGSYHCFLRFGGPLLGGARNKNNQSAVSLQQLVTH